MTCARRAAIYKVFFVVILLPFVVILLPQFVVILLPHFVVIWLPFVVILLPDLSLFCYRYFNWPDWA